MSSPSGRTWTLSTVVLSVDAVEEEDDDDDEEFVFFASSYRSFDSAI
jgi:hypothetical protein